MPWRAHISWDIDQEHLTLLTEALGKDVTLSTGKITPEETQILIRGRPSRDELATLNSLEALIIPFAGLPAETQSLLRDYPEVKVYNTHHNASSTAEMAIALMLASCKRIPQHDHHLRAGKWSLGSLNKHSSMYGKRVLVMGYGSIGSRVARTCLAMDMKVSVLGKQAPSDTHKEIQFLTHDTWRNHLPEIDVIHLCLPATGETRHIIAEKELSLLPDHACLINVGRGSLVDEKALYSCLKNNTLGCAGLDVWWNYPKSRKNDICLPSNLAFHELNNVVMTPHRAGDLGDESLEKRRMHEIAETIQCHISGEKASNEVDLEKGY